MCLHLTVFGLFKHKKRILKYSCGRFCLALSAGEVSDLHAESRREKLSYILQTLRGGIGGHQEQASSQHSGKLPGQFPLYCVSGSYSYLVQLETLRFSVIIGAIKAT